MADAGAMLAQLWGNNPIDAYAKGAQIRATFTGINNTIAAQTFENNLNQIKLADQQVQQQFTNQITDKELAIHAMNADTQRMFANQQMDPTTKQLNQLLLEAKINSYLGKNQSSAPWTPGSIIGGSGSAPSSGLPVQQGDLPVNPADQGGTASADGAPGILPALPGAPSNATPSEGTVAVPAADRLKAIQDGLAMATEHQKTYGQDWQTSLNPDNDPSPAEQESAKAIQDYSGLLAQTPAQAPASPSTGAPAAPSGNPADQGSLVNRAIQAAKSNPLLGGSGQPVSAPAPTPAPAASTAALSSAGVPNHPTAQQFAAIQPTKGIVADPGGVTGHQIMQREDGVLMYQQFKKDLKTGAPVPMGEAKEMKSAPASVVPPQEVDGMNRESMTKDAKGNWSATYKNPKGDETIRYEPSYNADGSLHGTAVYKGDKFVKLEEPKPPAPVKMMSKDAATQVAAYSKDANLNPDDQAVKEAAYQEKYGKTVGWTSSAEEWQKAYDAAVEKRDKAKKDLQTLIPQLQKGNYIIPPSLQPFVTAAASAPVSTSSGSSATSSVPDPLKKYYGQ